MEILAFADAADVDEHGDVVLRRGTPDDAEVAGIICYEAFKTISEHHNFTPDFPSAEVAVGLTSHLLARPDVYSVVAEKDGRVVGSNFLWENALVAGVGPITVDPSVQNDGVGRRLMEDVLARGREQGFAGIRLVQAAFHNRSLSLYAKLGFDVREPLSVLQGSPLGVAIPGFAVRPATAEDVEACNRVCRKVHGFERSGDLFDAIGQGTATVVEHDGHIVGYATLVGFFGHTVAETNDALKALIGAAPAFPGPGFLLPVRNTDVFRWCLAHGLRVVEPTTLMSLGLYTEPSGAFLPSILY